MTEVTHPPPTVEQIKAYLIPRLRAANWYTPLRMWLNGSEFTRVLETLLFEREMGFRFTPQIRYMFEALVECPYDKTKVVIYTDYLNPYVTKADGIAFSCSASGRSDNEQINLFSELKRTVPGAEPSPDLRKWCHQGVLLLSRDLTTTIGVKEAHQELYRSWNNTVFDVFKHDLAHCLYVLVGRGVWDRESSLNKESVVIKCTSPSEAFPAEWGADIFNRINNELVKKRKEPVVW